MSTIEDTTKAFWSGRTLGLWGIQTELLTISSNEVFKATITYANKPIVTAHSDFIPRDDIELRKFEEQAIERAMWSCPLETGKWEPVIG